MRRASRDYSKYLRGAEEPGAASPGHDCAPPPPSPPPALLQAPAGQAHPTPSASPRTLLAALVLLGLGQVICSVALFFYFRAQVRRAG